MADCARRHTARFRNMRNRVGIKQTEQVNMTNRSIAGSAKVSSAKRVAGIGCVVVTMLCAGFAHAADTSIKEDFKRAGHAIGNAGREIGHEAKNIGSEIGHGAKKVATRIAHGAKSAGTGIAHGAKKVGGKIGDGAKTAGRAVGHAAKQAGKAIVEAPGNIKESMTGKTKT